MYMLTAISSTTKEKIIDDIESTISLSPYPSLVRTGDIWDFIYGSRIYLEADRISRTTLLENQSLWEIHFTFLLIILEILEDFPINDSQDWTYEEISSSLS